MCLDVVHNHVGPEGNVLARFGPVFTDRYRTPWGAAINMDGPGSDGVRSFLIGSALRFMDERVPGIAVPAATIERIARASDPGEETYRLAVEQARHALSIPGVAGVHLTSFRRDNAVARLCDELGLGARNAPSLQPMATT